MPIGALALFVLMFTVVSGPEDKSHVEARALLERSFTRALSLPLEAQNRLAESMNTDLATAYAEAQKATDLKIVTRDEFIARSTTLAQSVSESSAPSTRMMKVSAQPTEAVNTMTLSTSLADSAPADDAITLSAPVDARMMANEAPLTPVTYISYTDTNGRTILIGIDADDTPILRIVTTDKVEEVID